jgi:hypothetical protein
MKFLFIDEFKFDVPKISFKMYGLAGVLIDAVHYLSFKDSFHRELEKIGWDKHLELKGRSMFSADGDARVKIDDRIKFMSKVVNLSKSSTGKTAKIHVYVSIEFYNESEKEFTCYAKNLEKIINKIPRASNKRKSLLGIYYDNNECIDPSKFNEKLRDCLKKRSFNLFESSFPVKSSLEHPGIMFADYVCYFHQSFLHLSKFRKKNIEKIVEFLEKNDLNDGERKQLSAHLINYKKEKTTKELIESLKKVIYVK